MALGIIMSINNQTVFFYCEIFYWMLKLNLMEKYELSALTPY